MLQPLHGERKPPKHKAPFLHAVPTVNCQSVRSFPSPHLRQYSWVAEMSEDGNDRCRATLINNICSAWCVRNNNAKLTFTRALIDHTDLQKLVVCIVRPATCIYIHANGQPFTDVAAKKVFSRQGPCQLSAPMRVHSATKKIERLRTDYRFSNFFIFEATLSRERQPKAVRAVGPYILRCYCFYPW